MIIRSWQRQMEQLLKIPWDSWDIHKIQRCLNKQRKVHRCLRSAANSQSFGVVRRVYHQQGLSIYQQIAETMDFSHESKHISSQGQLGHTLHQPMQEMYQISSFTENSGNHRSPLWSRRLLFSSTNEYSTFYTPHCHCRQEMIEWDVHRMETKSHWKDPIQTSPDRALCTKWADNLCFKNGRETLQLQT